MPQGVGELGAGAGQQRRQVVDLAAQRPHLLGLAAHRGHERGGVAVGLQQGQVAAHPALGHERDHRDDHGEDGDGHGHGEEHVAGGGIEGHAARVVGADGEPGAGSVPSGRP